MLLQRTNQLIPNELITASAFANVFKADAVQFKIYKLPLVDNKCLNLNHLSDGESDQISRIKDRSYRSLRYLQLLFRRYLLSEWLAIDPKDLLISYTEFRKPTVQDVFKNKFFSISHSGRYWAIAFSDFFPIGLDIERHDRVFSDLDSLIYRFFHPQEIQFIESIQNSDSKSAQFLNIWTQKEAISKSFGKGIQSSFKTLNTFDYQVSTGRLAPLLWSFFIDNK